MNLHNDTIELRSFLSQKNNDLVKALYFEWLNTPEVIKLINSFALYIKPSINFMDDSFLRFTSEQCQGFFIYHIKAQRYIGTVKLDKIDLFRRSGEIGIMIGDLSFQGQNIGTQSVKLILDYGFGVLGLHRIWGGTSEYNYPMIKLFQKFLFQEEGRFRAANYIDGQYSDNIYFGLLRDEREC